MKFQNMDTVIEAFSNGTLVSGDLKAGVANLLVEFLGPLRKFISDQAELYNLAYPETPIAIDKSRLFPLEIRIGKIMAWKPHLDAKDYTIYDVECGPKKFVVCSRYPVIRTLGGKHRMVPVIMNAAPKEIKGIQTTACFLFATSFDKETKTRKMEPLKISANVDITMPILWGKNAQIIPKTEAEIPVSRILKILKTLRVNNQGLLQWKSTKLIAYVNGEPIRCAQRNSNIVI